MTEVGLALVLVGAALLVAEAHVSGGVPRSGRRHGPRGRRSARDRRRRAAASRWSWRR